LTKDLPMMKVVYKRDEQVIETTEDCIFKILAYYSVFSYPLTRDEIKSFLEPSADVRLLDKALARLVNENDIYQIEDLYLLENNVELVKRRRDGNLRAQQLLPKAIRIGRFLAKFPYVRGIGISGGLSKVYAHENADFDFFIVTKANRLWIARTLMHIYKKFTFITGRQHYYCMNYYLDEKALRLRDQNIYTAIEAMTVIPVSGKGMNDFFEANTWVAEWFAEYTPAMNESLPKGKTWFKSSVEWLLNNKLGDWFESRLLNITTQRWKKKEQQKMLNYEGKEMALVTGKHFAWSNPDSFQEKIVNLYNNKIDEVKNRKAENSQSISFSFGEK